MFKYIVVILSILCLVACSPEPQISEIQRIPIALETSIPLDETAIDSFDIAGVGFVFLSSLHNGGYVAIDFFTDQVVIFDNGFRITNTLSNIGEAPGEIPELPSLIVSDSTIQIPSASRIDCYSQEGVYFKSISLQGDIQGPLPSEDLLRISLDQAGNYWYPTSRSSIHYGRACRLQLTPLSLQTTGGEYRDYRDQSMVIAIGDNQAVSLGSVNGKAYLISSSLEIIDSTSLDMFPAYQKTVEGIEDYLSKKYGSPIPWSNVFVKGLIDIAYESPYVYAITSTNGQFDEDGQLTCGNWIVLDTSTGLTPVAELTPDTGADASYSSFCITDGKLIAYNVTTTSFDIFTLSDFSKAVY